MAKKWWGMAQQRSGFCGILGRSPGPVTFRFQGDRALGQPPLFHSRHW